MLPDNILKYFSSYIENQLGIVYADHNYFQLENRLNEISKLLEVQSPDQLYNLAQKGIHGQFRQLLLDLATNNETSFFRDAKVFAAIEQIVLPQIVASQPCLPTLSIWSAASSSGQEALSTAILVSEWCKKNGRTVNFKITGTDISDRILTKAKSAKYSQLEVQRGLPAPLLIKYFTKDESNFWTAKSEITSHTSFRSLNLTEPFNFPEPFNLVLCRNVLIYQNVERKINILKRVHSALAPDGFLILGSGESLIGLSNDFEQVSNDGAVIYRRKETQNKITNLKAA